MHRKNIQLVVAIVVLFSGFSNAQNNGEPTKTPICDNLLRTGQMDAAMQCYLKSLDDDPANPQANLHVCQILEGQGRVDRLEPYLSRIDSSSKDAGAFLEMLAANYKTLKVSCDGNSGCSRYFKGCMSLSFVPPEDLEPAKAARLAAIEKSLRDGQLWFYPSEGGGSVSAIEDFPVITGVPLPYSAQSKAGVHEFAFNFIECSSLDLTTADFDSVRCGVPDTMVQLQVEIDDPGYEAFLRSATGSNLPSDKDGRYYFSRGDNSELIFQRKGRPVINKKYLLITSLVLTSTLILFQR
jgi:hypothetical protein